MEPIALIRIDPRLNMARFYAISIEPSLFGDVALVRRWGRIGTHGHQAIELFASAAEAGKRQVRIETAKRRKGYR
jgi:predicted DNA-binding WGR domain protein